MGRHVAISDTRLHVVERGADGLPLLVFHGGPSLDHHMFGDYLDPLADEFRLVLVDERSQGRSDPAPVETWTLERMAADVSELAAAMGFDPYATLGHSYGAFVVLQHAVDHPGDAAATIVSSGAPSTGWLGAVEQNLAAFEPVELREQVTQSWAREQHAQTVEECEALLHDQLPFHFADPRDPRIAEFERRTAGTIHTPDVLRHFAAADYGGIEVEDRLATVTQPVLVLAGRHDRTCVPAAGEAIAAAIPHAELVVFEQSGHMTFVEENEAYLDAVRRFLQSVP
jgi:proline iminopeptidase